MTPPRLTRTASQLMRAAGATGPRSALVAFRQDGQLVLLVGQLAPLDTAPAPPRRASTRAHHGDDQAAALRTALEQHAGNVSRVARALGVTRRTVYLRMERLGIKRTRRGTARRKKNR